MDETVTLRERRRRQTLEEIERAALALFTAHGFTQTTVEQIAAAAGVSPRTFFRYYPSKEAVLFRDHEVSIQQFRAALAAQPDHLPPVEQVRRAMLAGDRPEADPQLERQRAKLVVEAPELRAYEAALSEAFENAIIERLTLPDATVRQVATAHVVAGAVFGALRALDRGLVGAMHLDPHLAFEVAFSLLGRMDEEPSPA